MKSSVPKTLVLTGIRPGRSGIGEIFLGSLTGIYPRGRICCLEVAPAGREETEPPLPWLPTRRITSSRYWGLRRLGKRFAETTGSVFHRWYTHVAGVPRVVAEVVRYARDEGVELLWAPLHWPWTLAVARPAAEALRVPLVATVWDPPTYVLSGPSLPVAIRRGFLQAFDASLSAADRCAVASEPMQAAYERRYGTPCVRMTYCPPRNGRVARTPAGPPGRTVTIAYAGLIYAHAEWEAFLRALDFKRWRLAGKEVTLRVLTSQSPGSASAAARIEHLGWRSPAETLDLLSSADCAYLPYWFNPRYRAAVTQSFPSKLATYVAARLPVLYHGPAESSPMWFFKKFPVGRGCHTLDPVEIAASLESLLADDDFCAKACDACDAAYEQELSWQVFRSRFAQLMGVEEEVLAADLPL